MGMPADEIVISTDKSLLDRDVITDFLQSSYWASRRTRAQIDRSIDASLCFGAYRNGRQIGFARVVTDGATMYWLCDVFVLPDCRGEGVGKRLVREVAEHEELQGLSGFLGTRDAHGLYEPFGFAVNRELFMVRRPPGSR